MFSSTLGEMLDSSFKNIVRALRTQYLLGYYPKNLPYSKDRFHRLRITASRPNLRVLTRTGYYGEYEVPAPGALRPAGPARRP